ncbi:angiomotin-like 2a [Callorhinchus milii]|uniref:Angiomotin like 2 n=1 Tax=Callorhinchus milii TaxID=7868 RepID=V9KEC3_CALMI|nr:angiomotin-like 2a [Callorhinchus milii]|eukprot:gi/632934339/ref/XP_007908430.1/ PREDICTED: angiomotin-like protein 2 [Callorhinchus milii]
MRTAEDSSGTVLHRLIQEQLRYGNLTDNRTLLAIQQQALRGGNGSPRSSLESLTQEECQMVQHSTRQEPQGQEHQGDHAHSEHLLHRMHQLQLNGEELPTYEEAKAHSQFLAVQRNQQAGGTGYCVVAGTNQKAYPEGTSVAHVDYPPHSHHDEALKELKHGHVRSLSERLMQLSLERNGAKAQMTMSSSQSFPQLSKHHHKYPVLAGCQAPFQSTDPRGPPPEYPFRITSAAPMLSHSQQHGSFYNESVIPYIQCQQNMQESSYCSQPQTARATRIQALHSMQQNGFMSPTNTLGAEAVMAAEGDAQIMHVDHVALINRAQQMVEMLLKENENLRKELDGHTEKSAKIQKLEREIQRISEAYDNLMKASSKRETLEKAMRNKMEGEIRRLHDFNRDLREKLESANKMLANRECEVSQNEQNTLSKLIHQNKDHLKEKEKLQRELCLFRSANEDQRRRTQALEQALNSTQTKVVKLEDELRKKRAYVEKVEKLQHALTQLQAACEKREQLELRLRNRLEQELKALRTQQRQATPQTPGASEYSAPALMELLREKEERILALEADMTKWEQKYLEESTMRQFAMDAAATAAAQRDTTIINHSPRHSPNSSFNDGSVEKNIYFENGDIMIANHRHQEMESRIKALHAQILEKDAIIKVLQQRSKRDQTKMEQPRLRPAKSVPSITVASGMNCNRVSQTGSLNQLTNERITDKTPKVTTGALLNKGLRVDQAAVSASLPPTSHAKHGSRDGSTQTDKVAENGHTDFPPQSSSQEASHKATSLDTSELPNQMLPNAVRNLESSDTEMVEILI